MSDKYTIQKTSPQVREAIRRNTAAALPDRPSAMGMKPHEIRAAFFKAIISENGEGSLMDELDRIVDEVNEVQHNITSEVQLSTLTILKNQWEDSDPKQAFGRVSGLFAFAEGTASRKASILLLPVDNATRVESRSIGILVKSTTHFVGSGYVQITFEREGEAPDKDLKYVVISFSEPNETGEAFTVSAGFIGIGADSTDKLEEEVDTLRQTVETNEENIANIETSVEAIKKTILYLEKEVRLSHVTVPVSEWTDGTPTAAVIKIPSMLDSEDEETTSYTALLVPANAATRLASRGIDIRVSLLELNGNHEATLTLERDGEAPTEDLTYVVIAFTEANKTGADFTASASFVGLGGGIEESEGNPLPDYWQTHVEGRIEDITELQDEIGQNRFSYAVVTDTHYAQQKGLSTGHLAKRVSDACEINFVLSLGDVTSRGSLADKEASDAQFDGFWELMKPIRDRLLPTQGNHDGYFNNGQSNYYPVEDALDRVYRGMKVSAPLNWSANEAGYYVDDNANRVRYIMLNTCARPSGSTYTYYMGQYSYTQEQYDMVYEALSTIPNSRWRVVVASHVIPIWKVDRFGDGVVVTDIEGEFCDANQMILLLNAYANKESVSLSYGTEETSIWYVRLDADFTNAKGTLIAYHGGHYHVDKVWPRGTEVNGGTVLEFPVILHRSDSFNENQGSTSEIEATLEAERVEGTPTEHCFDVVTVDVDNNKIYCTRIGAGEDREIRLGEEAGGDEGEETPSAPTYKNLADPASSEWLANSRLSLGSSSASTLDGGTVTNYIPCKAGDIVHIRGFNSMWSDVTCTTNAAAAWFADENKEKIGAIVLVSNIASGAVVRVDDSDFSVDYTVCGYKEGASNSYLPDDSSKVAYMRFCGHLTGNPSDVVITVTSGSGDTGDSGDDSGNTGDSGNTETTTYTNLADPTSSDWLADSRLGSSSVSASTGTDNMVTNFIPCTKDDVIRIKNFNIGYFKSESGTLRCHFLDADKNILGNAQPYSNSAFTQLDNDGRYGTFTWEYIVGTDNDPANYMSYADSIAYMRFCGYLPDGATTKDVIITVNEPIE